MSRVAGLHGNGWPDARDGQMLRFLLHVDPDEAMVTWESWRPGWDHRSPTSEQYRLYPLMAERVAALVPDEPALGMLQGVRRQSTIQTLLMLDHLEDVLATLDHLDLDVVALKGAALVLSVYDHVGQRPFHDLDIFVDPRRHDQVVRVFVGEGWVLRGIDFIGLHHTHLDRAGVALEVHRKHSNELVLTGAPTSSWDGIETVIARRPLRSGRTVRILASADALAHTITHGTSAAGLLPLRWVADAQRLIESDDMDWDRVVHLAESYEIAPIVRDGLVYVRDTTGIAPPSSVLARLEAARIGRFTRRRLAAFHHVRRRRGRFGWPSITFRIQRQFQCTLDQPWPRALLGAAQESWRLLRRLFGRRDEPHAALDD